MLAYDLQKGSVPFTSQKGSVPFTSFLRHPKPFAGLRVFSGYAGWKPGQLEAEVKKGSWLLREADTEILFNTEPGLIWRTLLESSDKGDLVNLMNNQSVI